MRMGLIIEIKTKSKYSSQNGEGDPAGPHGRPQTGLATSRSFSAPLFGGIWGSSGLARGIERFLVPQQSPGMVPKPPEKPPFSVEGQSGHRRG